MLRDVKRLSKRGRAFVAGGFLTALLVTTIAPALGGVGAAMMAGEAILTLAGGVLAASQA